MNSAEKSIEKTLNTIIISLNAKDPNILTTIKSSLQHMYSIGVCAGRTDLYKELYDQNKNKNNKEGGSSN